MDYIAAHYDVILLDYSDAVIAIAKLLLLLPGDLRSLMVLLRLNYVPSEHLWILNFNLRIVEDVVIVVYIFDYLDRLLLALLFGL